MIKNALVRLTDIRDTLRINGLIETVKISFSTAVDYFLDKSIGLETSETKFVASPLEYNGKKLAGSYYVPTRGKPFRDFLAFNNFSKEMTFVDIGCGRGRVLWLAKEYGFKKVVGIEIDEELAQDAKANLLKKGLSEIEDFEVLHMNVGDYRPQSKQNFYYFYGPYIVEADFKKAIEALARVKAASGMDQYVAFHSNIQNTTVLDKFSELKKVSDERFSGNRFFLYKVL